MKPTLLLISTIATIFLLNSCTMEKRLYMPGYHVQWNENNTKVKSEKSEARNEMALAGNINTNEESNRTQLASLEITENNSTFSGSNVNKGEMTVQTEVTEIAQAIKHGKKLETKPNTLNKAQKAKERKPLVVGLVAGLLLIIVALLLLGLGFIFSSILGAIGVVFLLIFLIAAILLLIVGIAKMFT